MAFNVNQPRTVRHARVASPFRETPVMFKPEPGRRYEMPAVFGPSELLGQVTYRETRLIGHKFRTDPAVLEPLIPYHFGLAEPATVTIESRMMIGVDWLAGRDYHSVRVSVDCEARDGDAVLRGPYGLVVWESDPRPILVGREYLGISKIMGEIPAHERGTDTAAFECYEYGTRLLRVDVSDITPIDDSPAPPGSESVTLGWMYMQGPGSVPDADYPTKMVSRVGSTPIKRWTGTSSLTFDHPTWEQCPISSRIIGVLATIPQLEVLPATLTLRVGGALDRAASARLG
jgi:hypothetical protein